MDTRSRIFLLLDELNMEQKTLASVLGLPADTVSAWRRGKSASYTKYLPQIAEALGTTTEYLLTGEGPKKRICSNPTALSDLPDEALDVARAYDCADEKSRAMVRLALGLDKEL